MSSDPDRNVQWWEPQIGQLEGVWVSEVLSSGFPNDGEWTRRFEARVAECCETSFAVGVTSGTTALFVALSSVGVGPGDEVLVPDLTFIATANAVRMCGARPVLVDVRPCDGTMDPEQAARSVTSRTKAIVPVHLSGRGARMEELLEVARVHDLRVIEDAAEALGSRYNGRPLGSFGDAGCFSFSPNKTITSGQGGMVVTNDESIHRRLRELKDQGRAKRGTGGQDEHPVVGYNFKLTNLQSAVGLAQMGSLPDRIAHQRWLYGRYHELLSGLSGIRLLPFDLDSGETPQWVDAVVEERDQLDEWLQTRGVHCRKFWYPLHTQGPDATDAPFPAASQICQNALWLPSCLTITEDEVVYVCQQIKEWSSRVSGSSASQDAA